MVPKYDRVAVKLFDIVAEIQKRISVTRCPSVIIELQIFVVILPLDDGKIDIFHVGDFQPAHHLLIGRISAA